MHARRSCRRALTFPPNGITAVHKPIGWTSHDVVAVCRRAAGIRRVGHGGTLDPLASGVLPVLVGPATRFVERLHAAPKVYAATIRFGSATDTDDRAGRPTEEAPVPAVDGSGMDAALEAFRGEIEQVPPAYAAVKVDGRRAYDLARAGEATVLAARRVRVERLAIASWEAPLLRVLIVCSSGTYIRSIARDLGRALGSAAHLAALVRLAVGALALEGSLDIERVRHMAPEELAGHLRPPEDALLELPERYRSADADALLREAGA